MSGRTVTVRLEAVVSGFQASMRSAAQETKNLQGVAERNRGAMTAMGLAMGAAGAAITLGMSRSADAAREFESSLTKMTTLVGLSREQVDLLGQSALRMADSGKGPTELADALFFVTSSGLQGIEAMQALSASARASALGLGETKVIADLVTSAMNAYGSETLTASAATDVLIGAVRQGKAEAPELAGALGRVLPIASEMGVRFEEVGGAVAAMTRTGSDAAEATTQLRAMLSGLLKPAQQTERALAGIGTSSEELRASIQERGLWAALMDLRTAIGDNDEALGQIFPNVRALAGFLDLTGENAAATDAIFRELENTMGLTAEGFREWSQTSEASVARFQAAMEGVRVTLGSNITTPMDKARDSVTGLLLGFQELPRTAQSIVSWGGVVAGVGLTLAGGFLLAAPRISATKTALADLALSMPKTVGAVRGLGSLLAGPLGIALGGAVVATTLWANAKAEAHRRAENLLLILGNEIDLLDLTADAYDRLSEATRRAFAQNLLEEHDKLLGALEETGLALDDVARVLLGDTGPAYDRVSAAIDEHTELVLRGRDGYEKY
jgi:TP901 family phage tail tape measure protein